MESTSIRIGKAGRIKRRRKNRGCDEGPGDSKELG